MASQAIVSKRPEAIDRLYKEDTRNKIAALLPRHINGERFIQSAAIAWYKNKDLQKCTITSLMEAIYTAAQLGLDFVQAKGHAYLIPYKDKATFMPGYRGLIDLAKRHNIVRDIQARVVYKNELPKFSVTYGTKPDITHEPMIDGDPGEIVGAYAIAFFDDGTNHPEWMPLSELKKVRASSKQAHGPAYSEWLSEMYRKAPVRRLFKFLPSNPEISKAIDADDQHYELAEWAEFSDEEIKTPSEQINKVKESIKVEQSAQPSPSIPQGAESHAGDSAPSPSERATVIAERIAYMEAAGMTKAKLAALLKFSVDDPSKMTVDEMDKFDIIHGEWSKSKKK